MVKISRSSKYKKIELESFSWFLVDFWFEVKVERTVECTWSTRRSGVHVALCTFPMVISSVFRMGQCRDDDHREDALHFNSCDFRTILTIFDHLRPPLCLFLTIFILFNNICPFFYHFWKFLATSTIYDPIRPFSMVFLSIFGLFWLSFFARFLLFWPKF